jgi:hypothetical protein
MRQELGIVKYDRACYCFCFFLIGESTNQSMLFLTRPEIRRKHFTGNKWIE